MAIDDEALISAFLDLEDLDYSRVVGKGRAIRAVCGRMTHPEITGSHGEFETCPDWVPAMDGRRRTAPIILKTLGVARFDHSANWPAKVRNVSSVGTHATIAAPAENVQRAIYCLQVGGQSFAVQFSVFSG